MFTIKITFDPRDDLTTLGDLCEILNDAALMTATLQENAIIVETESVDETIEVLGDEGFILDELNFQFQL